MIVISDEIHCDLTDPGKSYVPFMKASDAPCIMCIAPTKTFNIAGLHSAAVIVRDESLRDQLKEEFDRSDAGMANVFAGVACTAAYTKGGEWLDELREYVYKNKQIVKKYFKENIPQLKVTCGCATYLLWIDCRSICTDSKKLSAYLKEKGGIWLSDGSSYRGDGTCFLRMNIACPEKLLMEGLERLGKAISAYR